MYERIFKKYAVFPHSFMCASNVLSIVIVFAYVMLLML